MPSLPSLLQAAASEHPTQVAVICRDESRTYEELLRAATGVAATLRESGVSPGDRVGIHLHKSCDALAALYGILLAGAAYVPLDPSAPIGRVATIADDCQIAAVVVMEKRASALLEAMDHEPKVVLVAEAESGGGATPSAVEGRTSLADALARPPSTQDLPVMERDDLAYILYTSGSSGAPKGVMLSHGNALAFVEWCRDAIGAAATDRFANHAPWHFDLSVLDLYVAAAAAATLVLVSEERATFGADLIAMLRDAQITVWYSVPSALMLMVTAAAQRAEDTPDPFASLRTVIFAGEVYPARALASLREAAPDAELLNLYGPTETNVCTYHRVTDLPAEGETLPIGRACENGTTLFVMGEDGTTAEEGELWVAGPTVMQGYFGMPERSAEALVEVRDAPGLIAYRTGDIVRTVAGGELRFLGRRDHQVKSRGYRIELGEIEAAMAAHPSIREGVAIAVPHAEWGSAIVGFALVDGDEDLAPMAVKRHIATRLPRYMVPVQVEVVSSLPRTSSGKVDRQELGRRAAQGPLVGSGG